MLKRIPHTYTILFSVILLCALLSWVIPAGEYVRQTIEVNGIPRTVIVDHSFHSVEQAPQTWQVFSALLDDQYDNAHLCRVDGALGIARIPYEIWVKWFWKVLVLFVVVGLLLLIPTVLFPLNGF